MSWRADLGVVKRFLQSSSASRTVNISQRRRTPRRRLSVPGIRRETLSIATTPPGAIASISRIILVVRLKTPPHSARPKTKTPPSRCHLAARTPRRPTSSSKYVSIFIHTHAHTQLIFTHAHTQTYNIFNICTTRNIYYIFHSIYQGAAAADWFKASLSRGRHHTVPVLTEKLLFSL